MQKVLVTGGAGFIGSHTVDLLLSNGMQVLVYDNLVTGKRDYLNLAHPELTLLEADILDYPTLLHAISQCDAVIHLAALSSVPQSIENPTRSLEVNVQGFLHVLQAIRALNKPIRLVYASSAAVYGSATDLPCCDETSLPWEPLSPYALEKLTDERYADLYQRLFHIKSIGLRYFNVFGPRQDPRSPYSGVISKFIKCYREDLPITIFGDGEQSRDFIHVSDVARANLAALQSDAYGIMNVATGKPETLKNLVNYIENVGGKSAKIQFQTSRVGDIRESYAKTDKAAQYLPFRYTIKLSEGIRELLVGEGNGI